MVILLSFFYILFEPKTASAATFDVTSYGAIGDGNTYDTEAFVKAWGDLCGDTSADPTLVVPSGKTFLIQCVSFVGPCKSSSVHFQLLGDITAPKSRDGWKGCDTNYLMFFESVQGLIMDGPGQIDGQGSIWWPQSIVTLLRFQKCDGLQLEGSRYTNSPKSHVRIEGCQGVDVGNLHISAPEHSPNTDGIDISWSSHINIHDSVIESGDDCVAINSGISDMNVTGITCGPGHGISIGSLGDNGENSTVEQVQVRNCNLTGTTNGVRIKTEPNGKGYARSILFEDINLINVKNPIIINQHYSNEATTSAVKVSDVTYRNIHGSSASKIAITFDCAEEVKCTGIIMDDVGITGDNVYADCKNVEGEFTDTSPQITCS
ncbi:putative polygalacturonase [Helianthus annuus]|uniref:Polygalacturonase n=1 Tax=Helianthus annuus TaxID=4232 RepID=A0A251SVD2_HELAN|nr:putative polygalacturonase [Helianthus annuus]KAJ0476892.1 putative endo-polygalacturonase [Helianthus annuus]KAJ0497716.1 putative endo-polygalacturonase [Helianthus annuus]KAJ0663721.1 putative endo-polygalacturonase [Helianthus annuus]KAJ0671218.1 putative endo-polygalacturonase [Helianthus annuus]